MKLEFSVKGAAAAGVDIRRGECSARNVRSRGLEIVSIRPGAHGLLKLTGYLSSRAT